MDDDFVFAKMVSSLFNHSQYHIDIASDGRLGLELTQAFSYDLILLDVILPDINGVNLCRQLRYANLSTPIILLTACNRPSDKVLGLDAGADDYVTKPCNWEELMARIRALLRRQGNAFSSAILTWGKLSLNSQSCTVHYRDQLLSLRPKEYQLLEMFLRNPQRVFSCRAILEHLWAFEDPPTEDTVRAHVKGVRQKLKTVGAGDLVETVYGLGYRLQPIAEPCLQDAVSPVSIQPILEPSEGMERVISDRALQPSNRPPESMPPTSMAQVLVVNILVVNVDAQCVKFLETSLAPQEVQLTTVEADQLWEILDRTQPDLLILGLPILLQDGFNLCAQVRSHTRWAGLPIVLLTTHITPEIRQRSYVAGADDLIDQANLASDLVPCILTRLERQRFWKWLTERDDLTQLTRRVNFIRNLQQYLDTFSESSLVLIMLGIYNLQVVNHQFGYPAGDAVLCQVAVSLHQLMGSSGMAARWSGTKFILVLQRCAPQQALNLLTEVILTPLQDGILLPNQQRVHLEIQVGIARYPEDGQDGLTLCKIAELALPNPPV